MNRAEFLNTLFQFCEGLIELRVFGQAQQFFEIDDIAGIDKFCWRNKKQNIFYGICTRDGRTYNDTKGGKKNIQDVPCVWCDIDFKDTPRKLVAARLKEFPFKPSVIITSGGGIHVYWQLKQPANKSDTATVEEVNRRIVAHLGGDPNSTDIARVLRPPETFNYKYVPPRPVEVSYYENYFYELENFLDVLPKVEATKNPNIADTKESPDWLSEVITGVKKGQRDATGTKISGYYLNKLHALDVLAILKAWNLGNEPPLEEQDLIKIVKSVSRYDTPYDKPKIDLSHVYGPDKMIEAYHGYVKSLSKNRLVTGITEIDKTIRGIGGGEVLTIIARSGVFKTAVLQNILKNYIASGSNAAAFFSIEMPVASLTERYFAILGGYTGAEIELIYTYPDERTQRETMEAQLRESLKNLFVIDAVISLADVAKYIGLIENQFGIKVGAVGIDYLGLIKGPGHNAYEKVSRIAMETKQVAKQLGLPIVLLCQASRRAGEGDIEITMDMARDSGAIEEGADTILGLYRIVRDIGKIDPIRERDLVCKVLKNRKGPENQYFRINMDPVNFQLMPDAEPFTPEPKKGNKGAY
jgi:hypothetical protein